MHPLDTSLPEASDVPTGVPKMVPYKCSNRPGLDAVYFQADSFAIILYNTMPREALVKAVKVNRNDSEPENLLYKRPPQLTEVTRTNCSMRTEQGPIQGEPKVARQRGPGKDFTDKVIDETGS